MRTLRRSTCTCTCTPTFTPHLHQSVVEVSYQVQVTYLAREDWDWIMNTQTRALCEFVLARVDDDRALIEAAREARAAFVPFTAEALLGDCDAKVALVGDSMQRDSWQGNFVLRYLALSWSDHDDFDDDWKVIQ